MSNVLKQFNQYSMDDVRVIPIGDVSPQPAAERMTVTASALMPDAVEQLTVVRAQAQQILAEANQTAAQILSDARTAAVQVRQEAHQLGYQDGVAMGREEGLANGQQAYMERLAVIDRIMMDARQTQREWLEQLPTALTDMVMSALSHLLLRELELAPAAIEAHVTELLAQVAETTAVEIRVHPDDFQIAKECHGTWQSVRFGSWQLSIVPDVSMQLGGAEVRSDTGRVDGRIETQLGQVRNVLTKVLERGLRDELGVQLS